MDLSERKLKILSSIVDSYVKSGDPISSKLICSLLDTNVSSATVRNEMAELTEFGLLEQPHTSAGRVPTQLGYRIYVDELMQRKTISRKNRQLIDEVFAKKIDSPENILKKASQLLANITNFAVVTTKLSIDKNFIKSIQFLKVGENSAVLIILASSGTVKNRFFKCNFIVDFDVVELFNSVLNKNFIGVLLSEITSEYIVSVVKSLENTGLIMLDILNAVLETAKEIEKRDIYAEGQMNLLLTSEFSADSAMEVIKLLKQPNLIEGLFLENNIGRTNVFIGKETQLKELNNSSIIVTKYSVNGKNVGSIGIVGPTRMDYGDLIANLEYVANSIGCVFEDILELE